MQLIDEAIVTRRPIFLHQKWRPAFLLKAIQLLFVLVAILGILLPAEVSAKTSDCPGLSVDGKARCIAPIQGQVTYNVCDEHGAYLYISNAWGACYAQLGINGAITSESQVLAAANCLDNKLAPPGTSMTIGWDPGGTSYSSNLCYSGTSVYTDGGYPVNAIGHSSGNFGRYTYIKGGAISCPAGFQPVSGTANGGTATVACKAVNSCLTNENVDSATGTCLPADVLDTAQSGTCKTNSNWKYGRPISPMTGAKTKTIESGFALAGQPLIFQYNTLPQLGGSQGGQLPSFGPLWGTSFHRKLSIATQASSILAYRGVEDSVGFVLTAGAYVPRDVTTSLKLEVISGGYRLTDLEKATVETYSANGQLVVLENPDGTYLSFTYSLGSSANAPGAGYLLQVNDSNGRSITFTYVARQGVSYSNTYLSGGISSIQDSLGRTIGASYDSYGNLSKITWPDGKQRQFIYQNSSLQWAMTGLIDERGVTTDAYSYDPQGRAVSTTGLNGVDAFSVTYTTPPSFASAVQLNGATGKYVKNTTVAAPAGTVVTTPNGQTFSLGTVAINGHISATGSSQPAGSGCAASNNASTYDANGNIVSTDDFQGGRTCYAYDTNNRRVTEVEGLGNSVACSTVIPVNASLPAGTRKTTYQYHPDWNLPTMVTRTNSIEYNVYSGQTNPIDNVVASCASGAFPTMSNGKKMPLLCKNIVKSLSDGATITNSYSYDVAGHLIGMADANGGASQIQYGLTTYSAEDYAYARVVALLHGDGVDGSTTFVDSSAVPKSFAVGAGSPAISTAQSLFGGASLKFNGSSSIKLSGFNASNFWNSDFTVEFAALPINQNQSVASVFGNRDNSGMGMGGGQLYLSYTAGLLTGITLEIGESGNWAGYSANTSSPGFTSVRSAVGVFNRIAVTRAGGVYTFYVNGTLVGRATANAPEMVAPYGDLYVGAANQSGFYPYFFSGYVDEFRITMGSPRYVTNYVPSSGAFQNIAPSNPDLALYNVSKTLDPLGRVTQFTQYDKLGRILETIAPNETKTSFAYTARGQVQSRTSISGANAPRTTIYSYDPVGNLTSVQEPNGSLTTWVYDDSYRVTKVLDNKGNSVSYTLDNIGNRTDEQVKDPQGVLQRAISRSFDALNRLQSITGAPQ